MNEEVKEILDKFKIVIRNDLDYMLRTHNCKVLLDYITNLQEEKEDYKSRCEKAMEYINKNKHLNWYVESIFTDELLNILNGGDEE